MSFALVPEAKKNQTGDSMTSSMPANPSNSYPNHHDIKNNTLLIDSLVHMKRAIANNNKPTHQQPPSAVEAALTATPPVTIMIQSKLVVNPSGDICEQEAQRIAEKVMAMSTSSSGSGILGVSGDPNGKNNCTTTGRFLCL